MGQVMQPQTKLSSQWIRYRCCAYLRGRGLSFGCSQDPIYPQQAVDVGKYSLNADSIRQQHTDILDADLSFLVNHSLDHVFIAPRDFIPYKDVISKLKEGGHLVVHSTTQTVEQVRELIQNLGYWQEKDTYQRENQFLGIWRLLGRVKQGILPPKTRATKRACIARYGAIGDMIMISPLIRQLYMDGYEVTLNITPYCADVLKNNPYVHNIVLQERDIIPNNDLGDYWKEWLNDYDRYINLSESIEGKLLKVEGRRDFYTSKTWRSSSVNYFDQTMRLGGYPDIKGAKAELYFSKAEIKEAKHVREKFHDKFLIMWALKGSSYHKIYPLLHNALGEWLTAHPDALAMLTGSADDSKLAFEHPQAVDLCGKLPIRDVFCLTQFVDLVGGPESSITNAAGCFTTPKITLLSHSTHTNLCQYWEGDYCLAPVNIACYPCHQLHYTRESCPIVQINDGEPEPFWEGPACAAAGIQPARLQARIEEVYQKWKGKL